MNLKNNEGAKSDDKTINSNVLLIDNSSGEPIYNQIATQIKEMILNGKLKEGDVHPSLRTMAQQLGISVITTKRAYKELELEGFIKSYTGKGSFVKVRNMDLFREKQLLQIEEMLINVCDKAKLCGIELDELRETLEVIYRGQL